MKIGNFLSEVRLEMKNVKWPSNRMATASTVAVILISVAVGGYLWGLDTLFQKALAYLTSKF
ncbi:MAG: Protein translocase subunit SecE [Patescibacteria group bacterium]|nr:Protein translocase subunit SecE [Patescibacteria group bacterium]